MTTQTATSRGTQMTRSRQFRFTPDTVRVRDADLPAGSIATLEGKAIVKGVWSRAEVDEGWYEMIATDVQYEHVLGDVRFDYAHDRTKLLGRLSSGTLRLRDEKDALYFELDVPDTQHGREILTLVRRRDIQGISFIYYTLDESFEYRDDGLYVTVNRMGLESLSAVCDETWVQTSISERARELLEKFPDRLAGLDDYYAARRDRIYTRP